MSDTGSRPGRRPGPRTALAAAGVLAAMALLVWAQVRSGDVAVSSPRPGSGQSASEHSPKLPTSVPTPAPTDEQTLDPLHVAACAIEDLAAAAGGWSGATGSMAGGLILVNVGGEPCRVPGRPNVELRGGGQVMATGTAPVEGDSVVLETGRAAWVIVVWSNWCDGQRPRHLQLRVSLPGIAGQLTPAVDEPEQGTAAAVPRCDAPAAASTIGAPAPFDFPGIGPPDPGAEACRSGNLTAWLGPWGAAAGTSYANVVVLNRSGLDCRILISPTLELRDGDGAVVAVTEPSSGSPETILLPAGLAATTAVGFANWCRRPPPLPLIFDLRVGDDQLPVMPSSERARIGVPGCNEPGATPPPSLGYAAPFRVVGIGASPAP